ncbi:MAG: O-antigen ligase family protein [Gemmatimonadales bacterium]|jgi:O-antigen ligase
MRVKPPSASGLAGLSIGTLVAIPLLGAVTGVGAVLYVIPLGGLVAATLLRAARARQLVIVRSGLLYLELLALFVFWMGISALWTIPTVDAGDELILLASLLTITGATFLGLQEGAVESALRWMVIVALAVAVYVFRIYLSQGALGGYGALGDTYLIVAQAIGVGTVLALVAAITRRGRDRWLAAGAAVVLVPALAMSLARGALLSTILVTLAATVYWNVVNPGSRRSFRQWLHAQGARAALLGVAVGIAGVAIGSALQVERTRARLERLFSGREFTEGPRVQLWRAAWKSISDRPFTGHGLGSSGLMSGTTENLYPHNLALQVWLDGGLPGLFICLAVLALPIVYALRQSRRRPAPSPSRWLPFAAAYVFLLLDYSKSSNFYSARLVFVVGALLILAVRLPRSA